MLLWGGTHKFEAYELEGRFFINPGSATGAFTTLGGLEEEQTPSFCLMDVRYFLLFFCFSFFFSPLNHPIDDYFYLECEWVADYFI